jgi:hypothetical protein
LALAALLGSISAIKISDNSEPDGKNIAGTETWKEQYLSGHNGADEDEIMDNIFSRFSKEGRTPSGHKTGQKLLLKDDGKIAAGTILEAAHMLKPAEVPAYLDANFENAWNHFDQNKEGWIRYEETHTFQRYLQGTLNKLAGAAGSIGDLASGGAKYNTLPAGDETTAVGAVAGAGGAAAAGPPAAAVAG